MARYPGGAQGSGRNRTRNRIFMILGLLCAVAVIALIYGPGPFGRSESEEGILAGPPIDINGPEVNEVTPSEPVPGPVVETERAEPNLTKPVLAEAVVQPNPEAQTMISEAIELLAAKPSRILEAREKLNKALLVPMSSQQRMFVKERLSEIADEWLFSRKIFPDDRLCGTYKVETGDQLSVIGKTYKVPHELIMKINRISNPRLLRLGDTIKVVNGPFHAKIYRSTFTMDIYLQDTFVRSYSVGLGKEGMETPTGLWAVKPDGKLVEPPWPDPETGILLHAGDPGYALGSRWIALEGLEGEAKDRSGFGIHGTKDPQTIGTPSSRGCIRLHNGDAIFVYDLLVPVHSLVRVED
ncbi:MAG: L,D-transpeptidase family protein [Phycisphaerales bacterium]|nr:MAG: L,D-transpeptidase family protein [Phycisphaerales bacterium]